MTTEEPRGRRGSKWIYAYGNHEEQPTARLLDNESKNVPMYLFGLLEIVRDIALDERREEYNPVDGE